LIYVLTFFKFRMLDIVPLAHDVIFDGMQDGVLVLDTSDRVIDLNPRLHAMLPSVSKTAVGASAYEVLAPYPALLELLKGSSTEAEVVMMSGLEAPRYYRGTLIPLLDRRKRSVGKILTLYDDTQVKQLLDQLERLATHDGLTGVCNRRYFNELAGKEIYRAQRYGKAISFIMLDVDHFKLINDTYGHAAGDAALKALAETIQGMLRQSDIIGRYGGEEFVILLPEIDPLTAVGIAEKLRSALEQMHIQYEEHALDLRASFGVTGVMPPEQVALNALQRYADRALYEAKETGRNRVCVSIP
jgi:diguanylate cyclase (GGDEF)-like protein